MITEEQIERINEGQKLVKERMEEEIKKIREGCGKELGEDYQELSCGEEFYNDETEKACFFLCEDCKEKLNALSQKSEVKKHG